MDSKILVLGASGMVGKALLKELRSSGITNILTPTHQELNLIDQQATNQYFKQHRPNKVFLCAAKVGGVFDNDTKRADYIFENTMIQTNVFNAAYNSNVEKLLFMASSCIYPKDITTPLTEDLLFTGKLEPTNEPFALAKLNGLIMAESFNRQHNTSFHGIISCSLYGPNDNFDPKTGHVLPGLISRMKSAIDNNENEFTIWGSGKPKREFLHVQDMAKALVHFMMYEEKLPHYFNVGSGEDISIFELAQLIASKLGFKGKLITDPSKIDGVYRKVTDPSFAVKAGWSPTISLEEGVEDLISAIISY